MTKKIYLLLLSIFLSVTYLSAQVVQTVNVPSPGGLDAAIGSNLKTVTDLTLTGTINATDFNIIKQMTALKNLDMSAVAVTDNTIPANAFQGRVMNSLLLPSTITSIGNWAFDHASIKEGLILPSSISRLDPFCFQYMTDSVDISKTKSSLNFIGGGAFFTYTGSSVIDLSDFTLLTLTSSAYNNGGFGGYLGKVILPTNMENVPDYLFQNFQGEVILPQGLKSTGERSFANATMASLELPEGLEIIGHFGFEGARINQPLVLPSSLKQIVNWAFKDMKTEVSFSKTKNSLEELGLQLFNNYTGSSELDFSDFTSIKVYNYVHTNVINGVFTNYAGHVILPKNMVDMPDYLFYGFKGTATLPQGLKSTGERSFANATMASLELPEGLEIIGHFGFEGARINQPLVLPSSLKQIVNWAFKDMKTEVSFSKTKNSLENLGLQLFNNYTGSSELDFSDFTSINVYNYAQDNGVFTNYNGHVILPKNMVNMPDYLFYGFKGTADLPQGLKSTGERSFANVTMPSLELPEGLEDIGHLGFENARITKPLILPSNLKKIFNWAFKDMKTEVSISQTKNSLEDIGLNVFDNYTGSTELDFSEFTAIKIYQDYTTSNGVFSNYGGHVILPLNMVAMPAYLFYSFKGSVELPEGLKTIGNNAFQQSTIKKIDLPSSVTSIGADAFYNATQLDTIISRNPTPPTLGTNVFYGVNKETTLLKVPDSSINLYGTAAQWKDFLNVNATIPKELDVKYSYDGVNFIDYHAVRIGEYYWIDKNFHHYAPKTQWSGERGDEINYPMTQSLLNKYMPFVYLDSLDYQVNIDDYNKYYGLYYHPYSVSYIENFGNIYNSGKVEEGWGLPSAGDAKQLFAMAPSYQEPYVNGATVSFGLGAHLDDNPLAFDIAPKTAGSPYMTYWFTNSTQFTDSEHNLGFKLMPNGGRLNSNDTWANNLKDPYTGDTVHIGNKGDLFHLFYAAGFWIKNQGQAYIHDYLDVTEQPLYHWSGIRYTRRLSDDELGYKLYKNDSKEDIVKLALSDTPPAGYTELEPGYLRGYYVKYILNGVNPKMTPADLYYKVKHYTDKYKPKTETKSLVSDEVVVPFKTDASVTLYPNPVQDILNISGDGVEKVSIYDMSGRQVSTAKNVNSISVSDLSKGTYLVRILTANGESTHKVIKK